MHVSDSEPIRTRAEDWGDFKKWGDKKTLELKQLELQLKKEFGVTIAPAPTGFSGRLTVYNEGRFVNEYLLNVEPQFDNLSYTSRFRITFKDESGYDITLYPSVSTTIEVIKYD